MNRSGFCRGSEVAWDQLARAGRFAGEAAAQMLAIV
jgi:hypothetical protein